MGGRWFIGMRFDVDYSFVDVGVNTLAVVDMYGGKGMFAVYLVDYFMEGGRYVR